MESVGSFEFNRRDLIGHGAFAVVFKGRHKEKRDLEVAIKCISKKNLAKTRSLLAKEIKILKELKHERIVRLLDYQEMGGCVYLIMEYCNGGDLADYLQMKGTLSEDTIRVFLQQIAQAMKALQSKGIVHRDLKPQNILLCHPHGRRSSFHNTSVKLADFGFARHLQTNTMAATLCGSPMYMAPEVIMSQSYDAKADLWSIGTIVYQCLTGKAPFQARTPQELRRFYECNRTLLPRIPKETSSHLRQLLLSLLQRNPKDRISFDEFFNHPFLTTSLSSKKSASTPVVLYPGSASGSSSSGSSTSNQASPQHSEGELQCIQPTVVEPARQDTPELKAKADEQSSSFCTEDFVMVPAQVQGDCKVEGTGSPIDSCMIYSGCSPVVEKLAVGARRVLPPSPRLHCPAKLACKPAEFVIHNRSISQPIPVPTQVQNYRRMEQNLQPAGLHGSTRVRLYGTGSNSSRENSPRCGSDGARGSSPLGGTTPKASEQSLPCDTRTGQITRHNGAEVFSKAQSGRLNRTKTVPNLQSPDLTLAVQGMVGRSPGNKKGAFRRSVSTGRLSEKLLKAAYGAAFLHYGSNESLKPERSMDTTDSPSPVVFTVGSQSGGNSSPDRRLLTGSPTFFSSAWLLNRGSPRNSETDSMEAALHCSLVFLPPELPEDTVMEQAHSDALSDLQFTLAFVQCVMEVASSKDPGQGKISSPDVSFLEQSLVTDQISLLSREWSTAEQLVLYMKAVEFLSEALVAAKDDIKQGRLIPSSTVKQVIRKLNDSYKSCVMNCRSLTDRLQTFFLDKQKLMDRFSGLTAEKLIYTHTVHMVQSAALDEMFHCGWASVQRYNKALLLMEGLSRMVMDDRDVEGIEKCKRCIERRLAALQAIQNL
ncbi:serine/threonine-protein kinase ULK1a isoform 1-T1 [Synchiropus picturatus]